MFAEGSANVIQLGNDLRKVPQMRFSSGMACGRFRKRDSAREQTCGGFRKRDTAREQTCGEMCKNGKKRKHTRALFLECVSIM